jgi:hypothetical protein
MEKATRYLHNNELCVLIRARVNKVLVVKNEGKCSENVKIQNAAPLKLIYVGR